MSIEDIDPNRGCDRGQIPGDNEKRIDRRVLDALRRIIQAVERHSAKLAHAHRLTVPQLVCLLGIVDQERISVGALAREVHLSASTLVGIVDRLVVKGLVERCRDSRDRRKVWIVATAAGRRAAAEAPSPLQDRLADSLERLSELERTAIAVALERVVDLMEAHDLDADPSMAEPPS